MAGEKNDLVLVFEKAKADTKFAKDVFSNEVKACENAGIELSKTELRILGDAIKEAHKYLIERLYLVAHPMDRRD